MAVASTAPMKIGRTRCSPSASRSSTMGLLVGSSTRTPTRCISTTETTLPRVESRYVGIRVVAKYLQVGGHDVVQIAVALGEIEAVTEHEMVLDLEADEADGRGHDAARRPVEQGTRGHRLGWRRASSFSVSTAWRRASGFRCLSMGITTCSKKPASRSAAVLYMRRWRASTPNFMNPAARLAAARASSE